MGICWRRGWHFYDTKRQWHVRNIYISYHIEGKLHIFRKVLDVSGGGGGCGSGRDVITYSPAHGGDNQRWYINYDGTLTPACSRGPVLDTYGHTVTNGAKIILGEKSNNSSTSQIFKIERVFNN